MRIRPKADSSLGWAYRPDSDTVAAHSRFRTKLKKTHFNLGADRPHEGGNLAEALVEAAKAEDKRRSKKGNRRRKMARKVNLKELTAMRKGKLSSKKKSAKRTQVEEPTGKMIPLKAICREMDLDPKATRVKLRRMIAKGDIDWHDSNSRWEFSPKRAKEVRALLAQ